MVTDQERNHAGAGVVGGIAGWLAKGNKVTTTTEGDPPVKTTTEP